MSLLKKIIIVVFMFAFLVIIWSFWRSFDYFKKNRKESSPFECGFDGKENSRIPFSLRFFYLLLLFLIFDVELTFFFHICVFNPNFFSKLMIYSLFVLLLIGLLEEWREGLLNWRS